MLQLHLCCACAALVGVATIARRVLKIDLKLPTITTPPRFEIFVSLTFTPSLVFLSQSTKQGSVVARAVFIACMLFSAFLVFFAAGWVVCYHLIVKQTVFFHSKLVFKPSDPLPDISKASEQLPPQVDVSDEEENEDEEGVGLAGLQLFSLSRAALAKGPAGALHPDTSAEWGTSESPSSTPSNTSKAVPPFSVGPCSNCWPQVSSSVGMLPGHCETQVQKPGRGEEEVDLPDCLRYCDSLVGDPTSNGRCNPDGRRTGSRAWDDVLSDRQELSNPASAPSKSHPVAEGIIGQEDMPSSLFGGLETEKNERLSPTDISSVEVEVCTWKWLCFRPVLLVKSSTFLCLYAPASNLEGINSIAQCTTHLSGTGTQQSPTEPCGADVCMSVMY
jgi:hypothetical protein